MSFERGSEVKQLFLIAVGLDLFRLLKLFG